MARAAGNTVTYWRCDVNAWIASSNDTSDVIRIQVIWKHVSGWVASSNIRFAAWADGAGGSGDRTLGYGEISGGEQVLLTWDTRVNRSESARTINCHASIPLPYGMPGTSTAHVGVSIPGIKYLKPNPPKNVGFTRENDYRIVVQWAGNWDNAARKPWKQVISTYRKASNGAGLPGWSGANHRAQNWDATSSAFGCGANSQIQLGAAGVERRERARAELGRDLERVRMWRKQPDPAGRVGAQSGWRLVARGFRRDLHHAESSQDHRDAGSQQRSDDPRGRGRHIRIRRADPTRDQHGRPVE